MSKVLVIGYGNQLRSDDNVGPHAVRELKKLLGDTDVEFIECHQLSLELSEPISKAELVVFVDASTDGISGEIRYEQVGAGAIADQQGPMSHHVDPAVLVATAQQLYGKAPEAIAATVTGECFGFGRELSPEVKTAMLGVVHHLYDVICARLGQAAGAA